MSEAEIVEPKIVESAREIAPLQKLDEVKADSIRPETFGAKSWRHKFKIQRFIEPVQIAIQKFLKEEEKVQAKSV